MTSMPKPRLPHLRREKSRHGRTKWYFRAGDGPRIRLPDEYSTNPKSDFMKVYKAALSNVDMQPKPRSRYQQNTLGWLFDMYQQSAKFADLADTTRRDYARAIADITGKSGAISLKHITEKAIRQGREKRSDKPSKANAFIKIMKIAFAWGVDSGLIDVDPAKDVKRIAIKTEGYHTWTAEEIERYEAHWPVGTMERLAFDLLLYTGLRRKDVFNLGRQHLKGNEIHLKTSKTGSWVYLPIVSSLQKSIDSTKTGELALLTNWRGQPHKTEASFGMWFHRACKTAGVPGSAHGLRKAGAVLVAERGATTSEMMAIFGWDSESMVTRYTRKANRRKMGIQAGEKLDRK